jgi:peptide-methionine (S)-S-oxide reductase
MKKLATFSMGCFWSPEDFLSKLSGVKKTEVGYAGGKTDDPTYENIGDHAETVQVEYDPDKISYEKLLDYFWMDHDPTRERYDQYRSLVLTHDDDQQKEAKASKAKAEKMYGSKVLTEIRPCDKFYRAEEYHQKYLAKHRGR